MDDDKVKLGVLWKNVSQKGNKPYLSGRVQQDSLEAAVQLLREGGRFLILSNNKRPDKQDPDCVLFVVPERPRQDDGNGRSEPRNQTSPPPGSDRNRPRTNPPASGRR
jgi:hypothetical protein